MTIIKSLILNFIKITNNLKIPFYTSLPNPNSSYLGDIIFLITDNNFYACDGTNWINLTPSIGPVVNPPTLYVDLQTSGTSYAIPDEALVVRSDNGNQNSLGNQDHTMPTDFIQGRREFYLLFEDFGSNTSPILIASSPVGFRFIGTSTNPTYGGFPGIQSPTEPDQVLSVTLNLNDGQNYKCVYQDSEDAWIVFRV